MCIALHKAPVKSHNLALWLLGSALVLVTFSCSQLSNKIIRIRLHNDIVDILWLINLVAAVALVITSTTIPRRPDVFFNDHKVDAQWTVSTLHRLTWSWVQTLLRHASLHNDIAVEDVPQADSRLRAEDLKKKWDTLNIKSNLSLFQSLMSAHQWQLALLWAVTLLRCVVSILPFWSMFQVLNILEDQTNRSSRLVELLALISCMTVSNLLDSVRLVSAMPACTNLCLVARRMGLLVRPIGLGPTNTFSTVESHL